MGFIVHTVVDLFVRMVLSEQYHIKHEAWDVKCYENSILIKAYQWWSSMFIEGDISVFRIACLLRETSVSSV